MIPRQLKSLYYSALTGPMAVSGATYRAVMAPRADAEQVRVHLGPGQKNYLSDWINVDANLVSAKIDVWADLRRKLPFRDGTVDAFYSHHVIEHLPNERLPFHFAEMFRCMKPGGVLRVGGPNGDAAIAKFQAGDHSWFPDFPDAYASIGGRFVNFVFCRGEHLTLLTESYLRELLDGAGFTDAVVRLPRTDTGFPAVFDGPVMQFEDAPTDDLPVTLLLEARKP